MGIYSIVKWIAIQMPCAIVNRSVFRPLFEYRDLDVKVILEVFILKVFCRFSAHCTDTKSLLFRNFRFSDVWYSDPHCIRMFWPEHQTKIPAAFRHFFQLFKIEDPKTDWLKSSLYWIISLILFVFVQWSMFRWNKAFCWCRHCLTKRFQWRRKANICGRDYNFTLTLCAKIHLWAKIAQNECAL